MQTMLNVEEENIENGRKIHHKNHIELMIEAKTVQIREKNLHRKWNENK